MAVSVVLGLHIFGIIILLIALYFLLRPIVHGAVYFPTSPKRVGMMLALAEVRAGETVVDLGSGDGRILIACAERGAVAVGYEVNPWLVWRSRRAIRRAGVGKLATVRWESFWRADLARYDVVMLYGITYIMRDLEKKFARELRPGTRVISNAFTFPDWQPATKQDGILLYVMPAAPAAAHPAA